MKKMYLLFSLTLLASTTFGQSPYTITDANFPVYGYQIVQRTENPSVVNLVPTDNGNWDYSSIPGQDTTDNLFEVETDPFYTAAGIDVYNLDFKDLNANLGFDLYYEYDFNSTGVYEKGIYVSPQAYSLGAFTGNPNDSLTFPFQGYVYPSGRKFMQFPATHQSAWQSQSRRAVNFNLTVSLLGLNHTPGQQVYTIFRSDSIAGWGKMRVYSNGVASAPYNVLINKIRQFSVDSFFLNGAPAPPQLLGAFGISQGQQTGLTHRYVVYREGYSTPLCNINYLTNNYTTPAYIFFDIENLTPTTGVETLQNNYSTLLFPNPSSSGQLTLQVQGKIPPVGSYSVCDQMGRVVQSGTIQMTDNALQFQLNHQLPNGNYVLRVLSDKKQTLITEQFVLAR